MDLSLDSNFGTIRDTVTFLVGGPTSRTGAKTSPPGTPANSLTSCVQVILDLDLPSLIVAELIDQLAYSWLTIFQEAISDFQRLSASPSSGSGATFDLSSTPPLHPSNLSSTVHCFTDYEPRSSTNSSISSLILLADSSDSESHPVPFFSSLVRRRGRVVLHRRRRPRGASSQDSPGPL
jgi:hypothetical protein